MTEIKIKEHDLHAIIKDLITDAIGIDRPNILKICSFVKNLVDNGGHKTKAARAAGYGSEKSKDGEARTEEQRNKVASVEGARLLGDARISAVYERLLSHRILAETFTKSLSKNHIISLMYQIGMMHIDNPKQAISALKEVASLCGYYEIVEKDKKVRTKEEEDAFVKSIDLIQKIFDSERRSKATPVTPKPISSEVYN